MVVDKKILRDEFSKIVLEHLKLVCNLICFKVINNSSFYWSKGHGEHMTTLSGIKISYAGSDDVKGDFLLASE